MAIASRKRARYDVDAPHDEYTLGSRHGYLDEEAAPSSAASRPNQILPVADLPDDFNGEPIDGPQYLAVVRQQARRAPMIVRVANPYEARSTISMVPAVAQAVKGELPSIEWRTSFLHRFQNMRETLCNRPRGDGGANVGLPATKDAKQWLAFVRSDAADGADLAGGGREPSSALLARMQTQQILHLLQVLGDAIHGADDADQASTLEAPDTALKDDTKTGHKVSQLCQQGSLDPLYARWLFALLAHLDERLVAEDISALRTLARACIQAIACRRRLLAYQSESRGVDIHSELDAWIVVCAVSGIWSQYDLWDDASDTLATSASAV